MDKIYMLSRGGYWDGAIRAFATNEQELIDIAVRHHEEYFFPPEGVEAEADLEAMTVTVTEYHDGYCDEQVYEILTLTKREDIP